MKLHKIIFCNCLVLSLLLLSACTTAEPIIGITSPITVEGVQVLVLEIRQMDNMGDATASVGNQLVEVVVDVHGADSELVGNWAVALRDTAGNTYPQLATSTSISDNGTSGFVTVFNGWVFAIPLDLSELTLVLANDVTIDVSSLLPKS
jgi:hypothetical protein